MTTNLTFPTPAQLQEFEAKCRAAFPALDWQFNGGDRSINAICSAMIPGTLIEVAIEFDYQINSAWSSASVSAGLSGLRLFQSTQRQGQSLDEAIALLRDFLQSYAAALSKALEGGDRP